MLVQYLAYKSYYLDLILVLPLLDLHLDKFDIYSINWFYQSTYKETSKRWNFRLLSWVQIKACPSVLFWEWSLACHWSTQLYCQFSYADFENTVQKQINKQAEFLIKAQSKLIDT